MNKARVTRDISFTTVQAEVTPKGVALTLAALVNIRGLLLSPSGKAPLFRKHLYKFQRLRRPEAGEH